MCAPTPQTLNCQPATTLPQGEALIMRSFLIRDILSGPAPGSATSSGESSKASRETDLSGGQQQQASSSAALMASQQSLAATQARFLAKLAEHQQQIQASKYYEQLQQQHQQFLSNLNLNHHHLQLAQLCQQQQQQQHLPLVKLESGPGSAMGCNVPASTNEPASNKSGSNSVGGGGAGKKLKTSSFAYDCNSPISSISDVEPNNEEEDDDEDEDDEDDEDELDEVGDQDGRPRRRNRNGTNADNNFDDDEEEIEVERLSGEELAQCLTGGQRQSGKASLQIKPEQGADRQHHQQQQQQMSAGAPFQMNSPLDALFQMTSSTFDALKRGEKRKGKSNNNKLAAPTMDGPLYIAWTCVQ